MCPPLANEMVLCPSYDATSISINNNGNYLSFMHQKRAVQEPSKVKANITRGAPCQMDPNNWSKFNPDERAKVWREVLHKENGFYDQVSANSGPQRVKELEDKLKNFDAERAEARKRFAEQEKAMGWRQKANARTDSSTEASCGDGARQSSAAAAKSRRKPARVRPLDGVSGWAMRESTRCPDLFYYHNSKTGETRWDPPPDLPAWTPRTPGR